MPLLTPSRIAVVVLSLSLFSFLWTWGIPRPLPTPSFPPNGYDAPQRPAHELDPEKPDNLEVPDFEFGPYNPDGEPKDKEEKIATSLLENSTPTPTPASKSIETQEKAEEEAPSRTAEVPKSSGSIILQGDLSSNRAGEEATKVSQKTPRPAATGAQTGDLNENQSSDMQKDLASGAVVSSVAAPVPTAKNNTASVVAKASSSRPTTVSATPTKAAPVHNKFCNKVKGAPNIMVLVKTSKGEFKEKLPPHLKALLTCVPNSAIFSDHSGEIDGHKIYDALESISSTTKQHYSEFRDYEKIQDQDVEPGTVNKELDKWKFLPMVYEAYKMNMNSRFYIIIEADTSLSWTNLLQWIDRLDYRIPYYSGAPTFVGDVKFAQRGSGIFLSQGALRQYAKIYDERFASRWEDRIGRECCGDMMLAVAMAQSHVEFYSGFPLLQGETPATLDWTKKHWCAPMVSWHHMGKEDLQMIWEAERNWTSMYGWSEPYLFRDVFNDLIESQLTESRSEWDNISADSKIVKPAGADETDPSSEWAKHSEELRRSVESPESCRKVCELAEDCIQWKHSSQGDGECYQGKVLRLGRSTPKQDGLATWTSGWMLDRIKKSKTDWDCKKGPEWRFNQ